MQMSGWSPQPDGSLGSWSQRDFRLEIPRSLSARIAERWICSGARHRICWAIPKASCRLISMGKKGQLFLPIARRANLAGNGSET